MDTFFDYYDTLDLEPSEAQLVAFAEAVTAENSRINAIAETPTDFDDFSDFKKSDDRLFTVVVPGEAREVVAYLAILRMRSSQLVGAGARGISNMTLAARKHGIAMWMQVKKWVAAEVEMQVMMPTAAVQTALNLMEKQLQRVIRAILRLRLLLLTSLREWKKMVAAMNGAQLSSI